MNHLYLLFFVCLANNLFAQQISKSELKNGDLIFQNLDCGPMCDAIEAVTEGAAGQDFSHIGLVCYNQSKIKIIEAVGTGVREIELDSFLNRTKNPMYVGRVKVKYDNLIAPAVAFAQKQTGLAYDNEFIYDNGKYYCSELVYDAFKTANKNKPFFKLYPMTYKEPGAGKFFPVWVEYFKSLQKDIPEGLPGCNPGGLSRSRRIKILGWIRQ